MSHTDRLIEYVLGLNEEQCDKIIAQLPEIMRLMEQGDGYGKAY